MSVPSERPAGQLSRGAATRLTDRIRASAEQTWELLLEAYNRRAWAALGYVSWPAYTQAEFGMSRSNATRVLDMAQVTVAIARAADVAPSQVEVSARAAAELKGRLPEVTEQVAAAVKGSRKDRRPDIIDTTVRDARTQTSGLNPQVNASRARVQEARPEALAGLLIAAATAGSVGELADELAAAAGDKRERVIWYLGAVAGRLSRQSQPRRLERREVEPRFKR